MDARPLYSVIIPMFNEQEVIAETHKRLSGVMQAVAGSYELVYVNDGSRDDTMRIIRAIQKADSHVRIIDFSRNFGHQAAVSAGLAHCKGDAAIIIDADLQDPPEVIPRMIDAWAAGADVAYGKRSKRKGETAFKKLTASVYYRVMSSMTGHSIPLDTGDFRLVDRKVIDAINHMKEGNRFLRGMVPWVGFHQVPVEYVRDVRWAGETKYPLKKMLKLAMDGIVSFSKKPLQLSGLIGMLAGAGACIWLLALLILLLAGRPAAPWQTAAAVIVLLQGLMFICISILGEYVGRVFDEARDRPNYIIKQIIE